MKKNIPIILIILIITLVTLSINKSSYSFIKKFLIKNISKSEDIIIEKNIDDIEDLIFIPKMKDFKKYFLNKINNSQLIIVEIPENILNFYKYNLKAEKYNLIKQYPVAVGKPRTPTPIGEGIIYTKGHIFFKYKYGTNSGKIIQYGHNKYGEKIIIPYEKMFGLYMIVNQSDAYVIHSTTEDWKIGEAVSGGCVRMFIPDMIDLYKFVRSPVKVIINYNLFKLEKDLLTVYPDIYNKHISLYLALNKFLKNNNINPVIFNTDKLKQVLYSSLPVTFSLNEILHDYFLQQNISFNQIKLKYKNPLKEKTITKINEFISYYKK